MIVTRDETDRCDKCGRCSTRKVWISNVCDLCGKKEPLPRDQRYSGDFYELTVFFDGDKTKDFTFCSPEHLFKFILQWRKPFYFMKLPFIHGDLKPPEGYKNSLTLRDMKRIFRKKPK